MTATEPVVLVLGDAGDGSTAEVGQRLDARGVRWVLLDTADFPQRMSLDARLDDDHGGWQGEVAIDGQTLRLAEVTAVYYRKPRDFDLLDGLSGPERRFTTPRPASGWAGCWPACRFDGSRIPQRSPTPSTSPASWPCCDRRDWSHRPPWSPTIPQRCAPSPPHMGTWWSSRCESYVDWRSDYASLRYEVIETPEHIRVGIARYLRAASLAYSAFDFVVTPANELTAE